MKSGSRQSIAFVGSFFLRDAAARCKETRVLGRQRRYDKNKNKSMTKYIRWYKIIVSQKQDFSGGSMEKDKKQMWIPADEPTDTRAKVVVACIAIALGVFAFMACIYGVIPALLS